MNTRNLFFLLILLPPAGWCEIDLPDPVIDEVLQLHWSGRSRLYSSGNLSDWALIDASATSPYQMSNSATAFYQLEYEFLNYTVVDTQQDSAYDEDGEVVTPVEGSSYFGQDSQYLSISPAYEDKGNGVIEDINTGLMWQQVPPEAFYTWSEAQAYADTLVLGGYDDWRLPTMKESLSLADFRGSSRPEFDRPYIDETYFTVHDPLSVTTYVPSSAEDPKKSKRDIDGQYWSSNAYIGRTMNNNTSTFGFNFIDGRIKSYPNGVDGPDGTCFVRCVRGPVNYGESNFIDNGDGTVTDLSTGLMWMQEDSGASVGTLDWIEALEWAENLEYEGYTDWRLPNAKELHSIVDYSRAPDAEDISKSSAAIDPIFDITETESWFWTSTSLGDDLYEWAIYICFGQALAVDSNTGLASINAHGAGAMRSDPKTGIVDDFISQDGGHGPQNDEVRIHNYVRPVRTAFTQSDVHPVVENPNILLLIVDDWGIDSSSLYNTNTSASLPPTPTIDALANQGLLFRNAYVQPTCSPTRAGILTGRYSFRHGIGEPVTEGADLSEDEVTLPEIFAAANSSYQLASFGKYHLNAGAVQVTADAPNSIAGWPHFEGNLQGGLNSYYDWTKITNGSVERNVTTYATTDTVNSAVNWIESQGDNPWFCWIGFNASHTPFHNPPETLHSYSDIPDDPVGANRRPAYEAALEAMDTEIGRLMESVDSSNTVVILLGDNGTPPAVVQVPYDNTHAKGTVYEGGTHVPFIISGPSVRSRGQTDALVHCVDLFSTVLELAGIDPDAHLPASTVTDSTSLVPLFEGGVHNRSFSLSESFSSDQNEDAAAVTDGHYKLIVRGNGQEELYEIIEDENEQTNLLNFDLSPIQQTAYDALVDYLLSVDGV